MTNSGERASRVRLSYAGDQLSRMPGLRALMEDIAASTADDRDGEGLNLSIGSPALSEARPHKSPAPRRRPAPARAASPRKAGAQKGTVALTENREQLVVAEFEPPQGPLEATIARILAEVLDVDRVGRGDSFYDFGGTSLQAIRICTRIEQETGRQAQAAWLFEHDTPAEFAAVLASSTPSAGGKGPAAGGGRHAGDADQRLGGREAPPAVADVGEQTGGAEGRAGR